MVQARPWNAEEDTSSPEIPHIPQLLQRDPLLPSLQVALRHLPPKLARGIPGLDYDIPAAMVSSPIGTSREKVIATADVVNSVERSASNLQQNVQTGFDSMMQQMREIRETVEHNHATAEEMHRHMESLISSSDTALQDAREMQMRAEESSEQTRREFASAWQADSLPVSRDRPRPERCDCFKRKFRREGSRLSRGLGQIRRLSTTCQVPDEGEVAFAGECEQVVDRFFDVVQTKERRRTSNFQKQYDISRPPSASAQGSSKNLRQVSVNSPTR